MRRFFIPASHISQAQALLSGAEFHHLRHVLRLRPGDAIALQDDLGREYEGVITHLSASEATISITATTTSLASDFSLVLVQGLLKGPKMDELIEKATELGVRRIVPFTSAFTVARLDGARQTERLARWTRIAQSAAKQSGSEAPRIEAPCPFADLFMTPPTPTLLFYEKEDTFTLKYFSQAHPQLKQLRIIIGSEGGFSPDEVALAARAGATVASLGTRILRAETAGIVAAALCQFLWRS